MISGYDDLTQAQDFTKTGYGATQTQAKGAAGTSMHLVSSAASQRRALHCPCFILWNFVFRKKLNTCSRFNN